MRTRTANAQVIQRVGGGGGGGGGGGRGGQLHSDADTHTCTVKHRHRGKLTNECMYCILLSHSSNHCTFHIHLECASLTEMQSQKAPCWSPLRNEFMGG